MRMPRLDLLRALKINFELNPLPHCDAIRKQKKNILQDIFSSVLSQFKKDHPSGNPELNNLGIFQSLNFRILMGKIFLISLKLNFTPNNARKRRFGDTNKVIC